MLNPEHRDIVAKLSEGLTEAQRRVVLAMSSNWRRAKDIPASGSTLHSLWDFNRSNRGCDAPIMIVTRDYNDFPLRWVWKLTDLGLALKAHLEEEKSS